jgi:dTDP-4-dehydrorhamnose reductase
LGSSPARLLVFGGWGQLGSDLARVVEGRHELVRPRRGETDVTDAERVALEIERVGPDVVINAAAFHKVELCELDPATAFAVNDSAARNVASAAAQAGVRSVFISTDYVFGGEKREPYVEDDPVSPLSVYGRSKAAGEASVLDADPDGLVVRTSGLFGHAGSSGKGGNFVETMLAKAARLEHIRVVDDQVFSPTCSRDLAERLLLLVEEGAPAGIHHATGSGSCSWYELARSALELAEIDADLSPCKTDRSAPVARPPFSVLEDSKGAGLGLPPVRPWREALAWYLLERQRLRRAGAGSEASAR